MSHEIAGTEFQNDHFSHPGRFRREYKTGRFPFANSDAGRMPPWCEPAMTPDGISTEEWDRVHEIAVAIVNASAISDDVLREHHTQRLFDLLDELEAIYGKIPSILDTRADFTDEPAVAMALYEEALEASKDPDLTSLILPSLIRLKIEECHDESSISQRLLELQRLTDMNTSNFELDEFRELQSDFEKLRIRNKRSRCE